MTLNVTNLTEQFTVTGLTSSAAELNILTGATLAVAELNILDGVTATYAELNYLDITTLGTGAASKAVVLDAGEDYTWPATGVLTYGVLKDPAGTTLTADVKELNTLDNSVKFSYKEDFYGTWLITDAAQGPGDFWSSTAGAGTATAVATTVANSLNGTVTLKSASDNGTNAQNNSMLTGINLGFKANSGGCAIEARVQLDVITNAYLFVGFTDTISTTVEAPLFMTAGAVDSDATDAVGMIFDTAATTDEWTLGGTANGTDTAPAVSGVAPTAATYQVIRVEVDADGAARGYINGTLVGTIAAAVTVTVALTPCISVGNRTTSQRIATIDYIKVEQNRIA